MIIKDLLKKVNLEGKVFRILVNGIPVNERASLNEGDELFVIPKVSGNSCYFRDSLLSNRERRRLSPRRLRRLGRDNRTSPRSDDLTELLLEARRLNLKLDNIRFNREVERSRFQRVAELGDDEKENNIKINENPIFPPETRKGVVFRHPSNSSTVSDEYDHLIKSIVVGNSGVGKTALALQFSKNPSPKNYNVTIGVDFHINIVAIETPEEPIKVKLQLWDIGVREQFRSLRPLYYRDSLGAVLVFDLTNWYSFAHLPQWIEDVRYHVKTEIPLLLVGNKSDLIDQRQVTLEDINALLRDFNLYYVETSAKSGEGVDDCFNILVSLILGKM